MVRKLVYDVVRGAALSDSDWENAVTGFLEDYGPTSANVEVKLLKRNKIDSKCNRTSSHSL